ncbi:BRCT domain [Cinara cedri]|uniref:BRCT domain n=1 Tax=Cinara cedri TaxID=506608 RepID=A0A5E4N9G2_9HEMI|nr:BRCT domain [Cinara cedri]
MSDEVKVISITVSNRSSDKDKSDEDGINMPLEKHVSDPGSSHIKESKQLVIAFAKMSDDDLLIIRQFTCMFKTLTFGVNFKWDTRITHFIIKTQTDNLCNHRTHKFLHALLSGCFIVNLEWVQQSLNSKTLLPENDFMPFDITGEPSPLTAWRVRRGIIDSPMDWAKNCIIYFHKSSKYHLSYSKSQVWAMKAGFVLASELEELNDEKYSMRVILVNSPETDMRYNMFYPNQVQIMEWLTKYKAVTIYINWFLECLFRFKFVPFEPQYQVMKLSNALIESSDLNGFMFQLEDA